MRRKVFSLILSIALIATMIPVHAFGASSVNLDENHFPDDNFRKYLFMWHDQDGDNVLSQEEIKDITELYMEEENVTDLTGLKYLTSLKVLTCNNMKLTALPELPDSLEELHCGENMLTELPELSDSLIVLGCSNNKLTTLPDLPDTLKELSCGANQLKTLPGLPASLEYLNCYENELSALPTLPKNLKELWCSNNPLHEIPKLPAKLELLWFSHTELKDIIDLSSYKSLKDVMLHENAITGVLLCKDAKYTVLNVSFNNMTSTSCVMGKTISWDNENFVFDDQNDDECEYKETIIKNASCLTHGEKKAVCTDCGTTRIRPIPPLGHKKVVDVKAVKPSFTKAGNTESSHCSRCNEVLAVKKTLAKVSKVNLSYTDTVYSGKVKTAPTLTVKDSNDKKLIKGTDYTVTGLVGKKAVGRYAVKITLKGGYSGTKTLYFNIVPKKSTSAKAVLNGYNDVKFSWTKSTGATGYNVYYKKGDGSYKFYKAVTGTSVVKSDLSSGAKYTFKVVPYYKKDGKKYFDDNQYTVAKVTTLKKVGQPKVVRSGSKVKVSWTNIEGESGYQISKSTKANGTNIVVKSTKASAKSVTISVTKGKKYYYKVRAYKKVTVDGKTKTYYAPWSKVKSFTR